MPKQYDLRDKLIQKVTVESLERVKGITQGSQPID
jgi:hypothetical protein